MLLFCTFLNKVMPPILSVVYIVNEGRWEGEKVTGGNGNKQNRFSSPTGNVNLPHMPVILSNQKEQHIKLSGSFLLEVP